MITGVAIKQENFRPLNKEYNEVKKSRINAAFFYFIIFLI